MIVRCPDCASRYRVREEKLPATGGNIQCPACGTIFPALPAVTASHPSLVVPSLGESIPDSATHADNEPTVIMAAPPPPPPPSNWKVRTPVGLVYDFPDLAALKNWLATRDSVEGMTASRDLGASWQSLDAFEQLREALPRGPRITRSTAITAARDSAIAEAMGARAAASGAGASAGATRPGQRTYGGSGGTSETKAARPLRNPPSAQILRPRRGEETRPPTQGEGPTAVLDTSGMSPAASSPIRPRPPTGPEPRPLRAKSGPRRAAPSGPRPATRPPSRPYRATRSRDLPGAGRPAPTRQRAGIGTILGLVISFTVIVACALQVSGAVDVFGAIGLKGEPAPRPVSQRGTRTPQPAETESPAEAVPEQGRADDGQMAYESPAYDGYPGEPYPSSYPGYPSTPGVYPSLDTAAPPTPMEPSEQRRQGIDPNRARVDVLVRQAMMMANEGRVEEAIPLVRSALQFDPENTDLVCLLSEMYQRIGSATEAGALRYQCEQMRGMQAPMQTQTPPPEL